MRTIPIAVAAVLFATAVAATHDADADPATDPCVVYSEVSHSVDQTLDVHLANTCSKTMACSMAWTVRCGKAANVTRAAAVLSGTAEKTWTASAASCTEDWAIDTSWSCRASK